jgi:hypothetical protein
MTQLRDSKAVNKIKKVLSLLSFFYQQVVQASATNGAVHSLMTAEETLFSPLNPPCNSLRYYKKKRDPTDMIYTGNGGEK